MPDQTVEDLLNLIAHLRSENERLRGRMKGLEAALQKARMLVKSLVDDEEQCTLTPFELLCEIDKALTSGRSPEEEG